MQTKTGARTRAARPISASAALILMLLLGACSHNAGISSSGSEKSPNALVAPRTLSVPIGDRTSQVSVWLTPGESRGNIVFSHGAGSAPWKYENLLSYWVGAGYNVYAPLHVDSTDHPRTNQFKGLASWRARLEDMLALRAHVGNERYIAAGHSYGALVALSLGGVKQSLPEGLAQPVHDSHVSVVLAFSPPGVIPGFASKEGYSSLSVPALIQTGLLDVPTGGGGSWEQHLAPYKAAAVGGHRYSLVLEGVDHYFGGAICRPELPGPVQSPQLKTAAQISLQMIQAFHENNQAALSALNALSTNTQVGLNTK